MGTGGARGVVTRSISGMERHRGAAVHTVRVTTQPAGELELSHVKRVIGPGSWVQKTDTEVSWALRHPSSPHAGCQPLPPAWSFAPGLAPLGLAPLAVPPRNTTARTT